MNSFTCVYVSLTVLQVRIGIEKKNRFKNLKRKNARVGDPCDLGEVFRAYKP